VSPEQIFLAELPRIERVIGATCRRHRLRSEEAEEFASTVRLKLIADDYAVLRKFQGRCALATYLTTVVERVFLDWRNQLWGKWRPSAEARRLGPLAVRVETLLAREGRSLPDVCQILAASPDGAGLDRAEVERIADRLPARVRRRREGVEELDRLPSPEARPDQELEAREQEAERRRTEALLAAAIARLPASDRLLVRMRVEDGSTVADIARALGLEARSLYRRLEGIYRTLRHELEAEGLRARTVVALLEDAGEAPPETGRPGPSLPVEGGTA
jgi:RNA polymerase sigma factor (sigma-70 family)